MTQSIRGLYIFVRLSRRFSAELRYRRECDAEKMTENDFAYYRKIDLWNSRIARDKLSRRTHALRPQMRRRANEREGGFILRESPFRGQAIRRDPLSED